MTYRGDPQQVLDQLLANSDFVDHADILVNLVVEALEDREITTEEAMTIGKQALVLLLVAAKELGENREAAKADIIAAVRGLYTRFVVPMDIPKVPSFLEPAVDQIAQAAIGYLLSAILDLIPEFEQKLRKAA